MWCDAVALPALVRDGHWSQALALYRGELLEGLFPEGVAQDFHEWLSAERKRLREQAARAAWECSAAEEARGDRTAAAVMARRARELDPDNEEGVRRLMELLDRRGDRGSALRVYAEWQTRLLEEFGVEPAPETRKVARRIQATRKGESHETPPVPAPRASSAIAGTVATGVHGRDGILGATVGALARTTRAQRLVVAIAATVLVTLAIVAGKRGDARSVMVVPLRPLGTPAASELAQAITEELANAIAADTSLVLYSASGRQSPDSRAAYTLEGAVRDGGRAVYLTLRLNRTADGMTLWAGTYEEAVSADSRDIARRISALVARDVRTRIAALSR